MTENPCTGKLLASQSNSEQLRKGTLILTFNPGVGGSSPSRPTISSPRRTRGLMVDIVFTSSCKTFQIGHQKATSHLSSKLLAARQYVPVSLQCAGQRFASARRSTQIPQFPMAIQSPAAPA